VIPAETKDAMQQAVRDALIAFMAATTAQARAHATKAVQRARGAYDCRSRAMLAPSEKTC
jgi:hypothetical protein